MADPDYFTTAEFRTLPDMGDVTAYPEAKILAAAAYFTSIVEREVGVSMIPRTFVDIFDGGAGHTLTLSQRRVRSVTSVTVNGLAVDVSLLSVNEGGAVRYLDGATTWPATGVTVATVTYSAGHDACPPDVKDAVMWATRDRLMSQTSATAIDVRKTSATNEFGGTVTYVLPGEKRPTGYPDLDAVIASRSRATRPLIG